MPANSTDPYVRATRRTQRPIQNTDQSNTGNSENVGIRAARSHIGVLNPPERGSRRRLSSTKLLAGVVLGAAAASAYMRSGNAGAERSSAPQTQSFPPTSKRLITNPRAKMDKAACAQVRFATSTDAGRYYCEHVSFLGQIEAQKSKTVKTNQHKEKIAGFIHIPEKMRKEVHPLLASALLGYYTDASEKVRGKSEVKILITGFGSWGSVSYNPTESIVNNREQLKRIVELAFGDRLSHSVKNPVQERNQIRYYLQDGKDLVLATKCFQVDDSAIDKGRNSIQGMVRSFGPNAIISLGATGAAEPTIEDRSTDAALSIGYIGGPSRNSEIGPARTIDNQSLKRAVIAGEKEIC